MARAKPEDERGQWAADMVYEDADYPVSLAFLDDRMYYSERMQGRIVALASDGPETVVEFEDVGAEGEQGLLGITFHPRFKDGEPYIYAYYTRDTDGGILQPPRAREVEHGWHAATRRHRSII